MRIYIVFSIFVMVANAAFAQVADSQPNQVVSDAVQVAPSSNKGRLYIYWGWNRDNFTKSDINFSGANYNFTLTDVIADDRQSKFKADTYLNPSHATIPQYNFRVGYYFKENWDLSFGIDHMKYVVRKDQIVTINGYISETQTKYDDVYDNDKIAVAEDFLKFEHTDGLNYVNFELRHSTPLLEWDKVNVNFKKGVGAGMLLPRTNTTLLSNARYDEFHISGYGMSAVVGINVTFYNKFFIQSELKGGFINLPDVRTTLDPSDRAAHNFFFSQYNIIFGGKIGINN